MRLLPAADSDVGPVYVSGADSWLRSAPEALNVTTRKADPFTRTVRPDPSSVMGAGWYPAFQLTGPSASPVFGLNSNVTRSRQSCTPTRTSVSSRAGAWPPPWAASVEPENMQGAAVVTVVEDCSAG